MIICPNIQNTNTLNETVNNLMERIYQITLPRRKRTRLAINTNIKVLEILNFELESALAKLNSNKAAATERIVIELLGAFDELNTDQKLT